MEVIKLKELLASADTRKFYIEYKSYFSNHIAHGIIALYRLGASEERIKKFIDTNKLVLKDSSLYSEENAQQDIDVSTLFGERRSYYIILNHYLALLQNKYDNSAQKLIAGELPSLAVGLAGSALHGMIQLGYGLSAGNSRTVCEGLAYIHFSYLPCVSDQTSTSDGKLEKMDVLQVLERMRGDADLIKAMVEGSKEENWLGKNFGPFSRRMGGLLVLNGTKISQYFDAIELPKDIFIDEKNIDVDKLCQWLVDVAITVYTKSSRQNDFFLLHGVTCGWSVARALPVLATSEDVVKVTRAFVCALLSAYMTQDSPALTREIDDTREVTNDDWDKMRRHTVSMETDEHVYKLVQVCYDMSKTNKGNWPLYYNACELVTSLPLITTDYQGGTRPILS